jgi:hypothetical protein
MKPALRRLGEGKHPVVVIDDFTGNAGSIREIAATMAPFPGSQGGYYPGLRRYITEADETAYAYAVSLLENAAPFIGGAFGFDRFDWIEASFSLVTAAPETLMPPQRAPHFDSTDPNYLAVLHYLAETAGTAVYRQRQTGIEQVDENNLTRFVDHARAAAATASGYIQGSDPHYERVGLVEGIVDRVVIYRGSLLHSGIIPPGALLSADPRYGRLTANLFVLGR